MTTPEVLLNRILAAYAGQPDETLQLDLRDTDSEASNLAKAVRALAAAPLDIRAISGLEDIAEWEVASGLCPEIGLDLDISLANLQPLASVASQRAREGRFTEAGLLYRRLVRLALVHLGEENRDTATYINALAGVYYRSGEYKASAFGFERAVALRERILGADHTDTAISLTGLARIREVQGRYRDAVALHRRALEIFEGTLGPGHPETGTNLNDLGCALHAIGEFAEAKVCFERALAINREFNDETDQDSAIILGNLGGVHESLGDFEAARRAHEESRTILAGGRGDAAVYRWALGNLGAVLTLLGDRVEAHDRLQEALVLPTSGSLADKLSSAVIRNNLGMLFQSEGNVSAAREEYLAGLASLAGVDEHPTAVALRRNLARATTAGEEPISLVELEKWAAGDAALQRLHPVFGSLQGIAVWHVPCEGISLGLVLQLAA